MLFERIFSFDGAESMARVVLTIPSDDSNQETDLVSVSNGSIWLYSTCESKYSSPTILGN